MLDVAIELDAIPVYRNCQGVELLALEARFVPLYSNGQKERVRVLSVLGAKKRLLVSKNTLFKFSVDKNVVTVLPNFVLRTVLCVYILLRVFPEQDSNA